MIATIEYITAGGVIALTITLAGWLLMHQKNHTSKVNVDKKFNSVSEEFDKLKGEEGMMWRDLCKERTKRIEASIKAVDDKLVQGFKDLKKLLCG